MQTKICSKCKQKLPAIEKYFGPSKQSKDGLYPWCRECKNKDHKIRYKKIKGKKRIKILQAKKDRNLKVKYGLTPKEKFQIYINQDGCCAICKQAIPYSKLYIDHNHKTNKVRGLLCYHCNPLLCAIEDKDFVKKAKKYLGNHSQ